MRKKDSMVWRLSVTTALLVVWLLLPALGAGCSFDPLKYFSRNACEVLNCEELFFVTDLFPLSAEPTGTAGAASEAAEEDEGAH